MYTTCHTLSIQVIFWPFGLCRRVAGAQGTWDLEDTEANGDLKNKKRIHWVLDKQQNPMNKSETNPKLSKFIVFGFGNWKKSSIQSCYFCSNSTAPRTTHLDRFKFWNTSQVEAKDLEQLHIRYINSTKSSWQQVRLENKIKTTGIERIASQKNAILRSLRLQVPDTTLWNGSLLIVFSLGPHKFIFPTRKLKTATIAPVKLIGKDLSPDACEWPKSWYWYRYRKNESPPMVENASFSMSIKESLDLKNKKESAALPSRSTLNHQELHPRIHLEPLLQLLSTLLPFFRLSLAKVGSERFAANMMIPWHNGDTMENMMIITMTQWWHNGQNPCILASFHPPLTKAAKEKMRATSRRAHARDGDQLSFPP